MDAKKMKIVLGISVVLNVALLVVLLSLKEGYKQQAQDSVKISTKFYTENVAKVVNAQNDFITNGNKIWQLVFETSANALSKAAFDARVAALDSAGKLLPKTSGDETSLFCGADCKVVFTFKAGKFVGVDYSALSKLSPDATFSVEKPAPFQFKNK